MTTMDPSSPRKYLERRMSAMKSERSTWESEYRDLQDFILPGRGRWIASEANRGGRRNRKIYDGTATYSARTLSSGLMAGITSPARPWFRLTTPDPDMMKFGPVKQWLEDVEEQMAIRFANSNLYNILPNTYQELGIFGTAPLMQYEDRKDVIRFYDLTVGEYWLATDDRGEVNTIGREFEWTIGMAFSRFEHSKFSLAAQNLYNKGNLEAKITIGHMIEPNDQYRPGMLGFRGKPWRSMFLEVGANGDGLLDVKGFDSKPFMCPRWSTIGLDSYGRGPGHDVLGDVISLQAMTKKKARAVDKQIDPPMNLPGAMKTTGQNYSLDPGTNNFVDGMGQGVNAQPAQVVTPNLSHFVADIQEVQQRIKHGLYEDLFMMLAQMEGVQPRTVVEIMERKSERLLQLGPVVERMNDELLEPMIDRSFEIMMSARNEDGSLALLPEPPEELSGVKLGVEFMSIFRQAQEQEDVTRTMGYAQNVALLAQATQDPSVMDNFDADQAAQILGNKGGVPALVVRSVEDRDKIREARAQQEQQMQQMQQAAAAVEAAKSLSQTQLNPNQNALGAIMGV